MATETTEPLVLYDGTCGLCDRSVQMILRHDRAGRFRFAAQQSDFAQGVMERHGLAADALSTVVLIHDGKAYTRSDAVLRIAGGMDRPWPALSVFRFVPRSIRDVVYRMVARSRYRIVGRADACMLPPPEVRARFLG